MEVRDLWPESIVAVGAMDKNLFIKFFEWLEKRLYLSATHIVVVTDTFKEKIASRGIQKEKISVFKNGANLELYQQGDKPTHLIAKYDLQGKFIFSYIGTQGMAHGLDFILDCVSDLQKSQPQLMFLFIGDGAEKKNLVQKANQLKLQNVLFLESVPKKEVIDYLRLMDVALVNLKKSDTFLTVIPSKIFEAAAMQKPILLGLQGETKKIIETYQAGLCFVPEDKSSFIEQVNKISLNLEQYKKFQKGCERLALDFDRKEIANSMLETLKKI